MSYAPKLNVVLRYAITDRRLTCSCTQCNEAQACEDLLKRCAALAASPPDFLLLREKDLPAATLLSLTRILVSIFDRTATRILVAQRPDIALAAGAHGVHLAASSGQLTPAQVRAVFPGAFVSRSCHTPAEVLAASTSGAHLILFGPVFGKTIASRQVAPALGLPALRQACHSAGPVPVLALGGVTQQNLTACLAAGASGIAAIRMFFSATPSSSTVRS